MLHISLTATAIPTCQVDGSTAKCESDDSQIILPKGLGGSVQLRKLQINYVGPLTEITPSLLIEYPLLVELKIRGNFNKLEESLLEKQSLLCKLYITNTLISEIPEFLFSSNTSFRSPLTHLVLNHNKLTDFPLALFKYIPKLEKLDVASNCIYRLECDLGSEFTQLESLRSPNISGAKLNSMACRLPKQGSKNVTTTRSSTENSLEIFNPINNQNI